MLPPLCSLLFGRTMYNGAETVRPLTLIVMFILCKISNYTLFDA